MAAVLSEENYLLQLGASHIDIDLVRTSSNRFEGTGSIRMPDDDGMFGQSPQSGSFTYS